MSRCINADLLRFRFLRHKNRGKLSDLVAEHLDHLHYLNDILTINCEFLNDVLTDHLLNRLFLPLYVYSLVSQEQVSARTGLTINTAAWKSSTRSSRSKTCVQSCGPELVKLSGAV